MALGNVDVALAKTALQNLKNSLDSSTEQDIYTSIISTDTFKSDARTPLQKGFELLLNERMEEVKKLIDTYLQIMDLISEYQGLEEDVADYEERIDDEQDDDDPSYSKIKRLRKAKNACLDRMHDIEIEIDSKI